MGYNSIRNPRFAAAWRKGRRAAEKGLPRSACPYPDIRGISGFNTWSRAFRSHWYRGYDAAEITNVH